MLTTVQKMLNDESGATAIEYGLIAALIGAALVTVLTTLQGNLTGLFSEIGTAIENKGNGGG